jgi:hypothetical protein
MGRLYPWAAMNTGVLTIVWIGTVGIHFIFNYLIRVFSKTVTEEEKCL